MAMINCSECGKEISDKAATCPNCGCPIGGESSNNNNDEYFFVMDILKKNNYNATKSIKEYRLQTGAGLKEAEDIIYYYMDITGRGSKKKSKSNTIWGLLLIFGLFFILIGSSGKKETNTQNAPTSSTVKPKENESAKTEETKEEINATEFTYGKCSVKYINHEIMINDRNETLLVVYYDFTNINDDEPRSFDYYVTGKAYQNGVELDSSWFHANEESKNGGKAIQKGTTLTVADSYVLGESRDNVTIEFRPFNIWSDKLLMSLELELE